MVRFFKNLYDPVILAAVLAAFLLYSGILPVRSPDSFCCLIKNEQITRISGIFCSDPVKQRSGAFYRIDLKTSAASDSDGNISSCTGKITVLIPSEIAEAYMPGKLYSESCSCTDLLCEKGYSAELYGYFKKNGTYHAAEGKNIEQKKSFVTKILRFRSVSRMNFRRIMYAWKDAGGLFLALISGMREYADESLCQNFRKAGLSHILALSGMHLSLFSGIFFFFSRKVASKRASEAASIPVIIIFVWFAGVSPSLFRALLCSLTAVFCTLCGFKSVKMIKILAFSFIIHVCTRIQDVYNLGFILSYSALAGILLSGEIFNLIFSSRLPLWISEPLGAGSGAQAFTAPVSVTCTGAFSPVGIIASVTVSPLISLFIYSGLIIMLLCFIFPDFVQTGAFFMKILYNVIKQTVRVFAFVPNLTF